jgi:hypothetical protein
MSPVEQKAMITRAVAQVINELTVAGVENAPAAVMREAVLQARVHRGPERAISAARQIADEMEAMG